MVKLNRDYFGEFSILSGATFKHQPISKIATKKDMTKRKGKSLLDYQEETITKLMAEPNCGASFLKVLENQLQISRDRIREFIRSKF